MTEKGYFETRLAFDERRSVLWTTLCDAYFQRLIPEDAHVLELGAGYGDFINNVDAGRRTAVDQWEGFAHHLQPGVEPHVGSVEDLSFLADSSVDFAFASNLFEHLPAESFTTCLAELRRVIAPTGTLNILQPNYRRAYKEYFDDYTHVAVYSDISLRDVLGVNGFEVFLCHPGFLPLTVKSRLPVSSALIRLYLASPVKPMGKQMFLRARLADR